MLRVDQLFDSNGDPVLSPYGVASQMQVTILAAFTGIQTNLGGGNNYIITGFTDFRMYYDGPTGGFTNASFGGALTNFSDGRLVESALFASGSGVNAPLAPDGSTDVTVGLLDLLTGADFEVSPTGAPTPFGYTAFTNSNNHLCVEPLQTCASSTDAILAVFGQTDSPGFTFHSKSDGSIEKVTAIPAPETLSLVGLGLVIIGFVCRRKGNSGLTRATQTDLASALT